MLCPSKKIQHIIVERERLTGTIACSLDLLINSMLRGVYWNRYNSNANLFPLVVKSWRQKRLSSYCPSGITVIFI